MENISKYITYTEATKSNTAIKYHIDNKPSDEQLAAMKLVGTEIFDKVRAHFNKAIGISSFFRSEKLNKKIGGAKGSQHTKGQAIDIDADIYGGLTNKQIYDYIKDNLEYDQLINEFNYSWIHVSYVSKEANRNRKLDAIKSNGKTAYRLVD
jgi:zinc D-Ala-D-Ala carboxypeptidase